ncbi:MAG: type II toxin-antitoxin system RelE/ParE family toxin [archaeon]|nr:type II toxin-antitoxin system RelE/ParE family toxin [Nanoarchaeota archaeon]
MYQIFTTEEFDKRYKKLDKSIKNEVAKEIDQLEENPYSGKPLGYKFFREKKVRNYRFYYLIYDGYVVVFVITISTKKDQQDAIDKIKRLIPYYQKEIIKKLNL